MSYLRDLFIEETFFKGFCFMELASNLGLNYLMHWLLFFFLFFVFFKSIWLLLFSTCQKPKWNNLPITHWTYTTTNIIKSYLNFLNPQNTQNFSLCKCVSTCTAVGSVIKNMVINIGDMIYLLSLSWMWKYRVWCIPIIHNIKTTDMWSDMQIIFLQQCSALNAPGIHLDATFICNTHPNVWSTGAQHSISGGVLRCLTPGGGPSVNQILDEIGIWLIWRSGWAIFSHVLGHSGAVLILLWNGLSRWWRHCLWGAYMVCSGLWLVVGYQSGIHTNSRT